LLRLVNNDPYVKLQERQIEKAQLGLSLFTYSGREEPYEVRRLSLEKEKNQLAGMKERLRETVTNRYLALNQLFNQSSALELDIQNLRAQERNLACAFSWG
jgi:predicted  nucleic acid-binding Zn-ribbon protein